MGMGFVSSVAGWPSARAPLLSPRRLRNLAALWRSAASSKAAAAAGSGAIVASAGGKQSDTSRARGLRAHASAGSKRSGQPRAGISLAHANGGAAHNQRRAGFGLGSGLGSGTGFGFGANAARAGPGGQTTARRRGVPPPLANPSCSIVAVAVAVEANKARCKFDLIFSTLHKFRPLAAHPPRQQRELSFHPLARTDRRAGTHKHTHTHRHSERPTQTHYH